MKKFLPLVFLCFIGCAAFNQAKSDFQSCLADDECNASITKTSKMYGQIGQTVGGATGIPLAGQVAGGIFGGLALLIAGIAGGHSLPKKNEEPKK